MTTTPIHPTPGTDNARMLTALLEAAPHTAWNLDSTLMLKANSRASELRKLGWEVEHVQRARVGSSRKRDHGYRLLNAASSEAAA